MEDKDLFEKVEKAFGITENQKIRKIYESGNFKKQLDEVVTSKSPSTGSSNLLGSIGKGIGAVARSIPGTRGFKMRSAEARSAEAAARKAELENARLFAKLQKGDLSDGEAQDMLQNMLRNASEEFKKVYARDGRFKNAVDMGAKGKFNDLSDADKDYHNKIQQQITQAEKAKAGEEKEEKLTKDKVLALVPDFLSTTLLKRIGNNRIYTDFKDNIEYFAGDDTEALKRFAILNINQASFQVLKTDIKNNYYKIFGKAIAKTSLQQAIEGQYSIDEINAGKIDSDDLDIELKDARKFAEDILFKVLPKTVLDRRKDFVIDSIDDYFKSIKQLSDKQTKLPLDNGESKKEPVIKSPKRKKAEAKRKLKSTEEIGDEAKKILASKIKKAKVKPKYTSQNLDDTADQA